MENKTKTEYWMCVICKREFTGWGNNPDPIAPPEGRCCDECNETAVIPARLRAAGINI